MSDEQEHINNFDSHHAHRRGPLTPEQRARKQQKFLQAYREVGIIKYACKVAGVSRATFYDWRDHDPEFAAQISGAKEDACDTLEYAAYAQAVLGVEEPVVSMGQPVFYKGKPLTVRKYSPSVLITLLKANMPEKYKDRQESTVQMAGEVAIYLPQKKTLDGGQQQGGEGDGRSSP